MANIAIISLIVAVLVAGCATGPAPKAKADEPTLRQSMGRRIAVAGQATGKLGSGIIMTAGISILTLPLVVIGLPITVVALPIYYGGCAISGDESEPHPFDL